MLVQPLATASFSISPRYAANSRRSAKPRRSPPSASKRVAKWSGSPAQALIASARTLSTCTASVVEYATPLPILPLPSMSTLGTPRRASCAARIVPEAPPPTIATGSRSDFVVRPILRVSGARLAPHHMLVHAGNHLAGSLREEAGNDRVDE